MRFLVHFLLPLLLVSLAATFSASAERITHQGDDGVGLTGPLTTVEWNRHANGVYEFIIESSHETYPDAPISCELAVNGVLAFKRIRSKELPENILHFLIGPDIAVPPYNVNITCSAMAVKRQPTTTMAIAVFATDLTNTLDCTLTVDDGETVVVANELETAQAGETGLTLQFEAKSADGEEDFDVNGSFAVDLKAGTANGSLTIQRETFDESILTAVSGTTGTDDSGRLDRIDVESTDGSTTLSCS